MKAILLPALVTALLCTTAGAQSWQSPTEVTDARGTGGVLGAYTSMAIVNGRPAIASVDGTHSRISWVRAQDADGTAWDAPVSISTPGVDGTHLSMMVVNGLPAIAYYKAEGITNGALMFVRANDADGATWGTPVLVDSVGNSGKRASLRIVNGMPAIAYQRTLANEALMFVRANDANGGSWGTPSQIAFAQPSQLHGLSLEVVNGAPAIAFSSFQATRYVRSSDANGSAWPTSDVLFEDFASQRQVSLRVIAGVPCVVFYNSDDVHLKFQRANDVDGASWANANDVHLAPLQVTSSVLLEVEGRPAIVYQRSVTDELVYLRSSDALGSTWNSPVELDIVGGLPAYPSFIVVNGFPAVAYYKEDTNLPGELRFVRATEATGTALWNAPIGFRTTPDVGEHVSQAFVVGFPALAYYDATNKDLRYVRATDELGSTWGASITIDSVNACGSYASMAVVNGNPAITYYDETLNLKYVRAIDALGTTWGTPVVLPAAAASYGQSSSLVVIGGRPAVAFVSSGGPVYYIRALNADGSAWPASSNAVASSAGIGVGISMVELNGLPALAYFGFNMDLMFSAASNISGTSWAPAVNVDATGVVGHYPSLAIVEGTPAIAYYDLTNTNLKYARANLSNGTGWGVTTVDNSGSVGKYPTLLVAGGNPVIAYVGDGGVRIKRSTTVTGVQGWSGTPIQLATSFNVLAYVSMRMNGDLLGISYYDPYQGYAYYLAGAQCALATPPPVNVTEPADLLVCNLASTTLSVTGDNVSWHGSLSGGTILGVGNTFTTPGLTSTTTYYAQDSACYRSARVAIQVTVSPAINANVIVDGYQLTAEATGVDYQWIDCNNGSAPIANATEQTYEAPVSGSYAVVLTAGECSVTSTCQVVISTATAGTTMEHGVKVYPVPARDELWVSSVQQGGLYIELLDMTGRVVMQRAHQGDLFRSEIEHLPRGCYTVRVRSGSTTSSHRVVLQ